MPREKEFQRKKKDTRMPVRDSHRENEHLTAFNERLTEENEMLRAEVKDFRFLRKVLGSQQIDSLIAQAKAVQQTRHKRNTNRER